MKKRTALIAFGLGATYLLRNNESRDKLSRQFDDFNETPMRGDRSRAHHSDAPNERKKGLLGKLFS